MGVPATPRPSLQCGAPTNGTEAQWNPLGPDVGITEHEDDHGHHAVQKEEHDVETLTSWCKIHPLAIPDWSNQSNEQSIKRANKITKRHAQNKTLGKAKKAIQENTLLAVA